MDEGNIQYVDSPVTVSTAFLEEANVRSVATSTANSST